MDEHTRICRNNWVITVESSNEKQLAMIRSAVAKRAYHLFEQRGRTYGFDFGDWMAAEKQLVTADSQGDSSAFRFVIECPGDPHVTTILSLTGHSLIVLRSHTARLIHAAQNEPEVVSVYVVAEEIDPTRVEVKSVDGLLYVHVPKKKDGG